MTLFVWEDNNKLNNYIKKKIKIILKIKNNKYTIKVDKIDQITYIKQTIIDRIE